ncbi:hypothetical protein [uncultured Sphingomonas sp.]|uniref:hypothetical protein n=1 Tax=uncultured Sphingomonas sp. TaxID=158754 RepID=UPI0025D46AFF|nr:hypothetical protein [uncultured Sphingomonas sp.]
MAVEGALDMVGHLLDRDGRLLVRAAESALRDDAVAIDQRAQVVLADTAPAHPFNIIVIANVRHRDLRGGIPPPPS